MNLYQLRVWVGDDEYGIRCDGIRSDAFVRWQYVGLTDCCVQELLFYRYVTGEFTETKGVTTAPSLSKARISTW
ncbi:hypothetical protein KCU62_g395, partial [Aureobasidium sp. EXF-3399]